MRTQDQMLARFRREATTNTGGLMHTIRCLQTIRTEARAFATQFSDPDRLADDLAGIDAAYRTVLAELSEKAPA